MHICICIRTYIANYNLLNPYNGTGTHVFWDGCLALNEKLYFSLGKKLHKIAINTFYDFKQMSNGIIYSFMSKEVGLK